MFKREKFLQIIAKRLDVNPVCALLGPRQCGKTTVAAQYAKEINPEPQKIHHFDLENPEDLTALSNPLRALEHLSGLVIIDEIQRIPDLFPVLRVLVDRKQTNYLILGSASRDLIHQSSETLAGRISYIELTPFQLSEGFEVNALLLRGGFPKSYLAKNDEDSFLWRNDYVQTFLERDIPNLGFSIPPLMLRRFWMMLTHVHGQLINMNELATSLGVSGHTIRNYLDILAGTFMIRIMVPWFENIHKRQIKTPKLFFRDTGILLLLLGLRNESEYLRHPKLGLIWEGFALEQIIQTLNLRPEEVFFWRTQDGAELDLFVIVNGQRYGFEFKYSDSPKTTKSMHIALKELRLKQLFIIYPGQREIIFNDKIKAMGLDDFTKKSNTYIN